MCPRVVRGPAVCRAGIVLYLRTFLRLDWRECSSSRCESLHCIARRCRAHCHCRGRHCVLAPQTLRIRSVDSFWQPGLDPAILRMRHEAYTALRHEKMKAVRDARRAVIAEELERGDGGYASSGKSSFTSAKSSLTSRSATGAAGTMDLERVRRKQQKEIEAMMAHEMKTQQIAEEQERREVRRRCAVDAGHRHPSFHTAHARTRARAHTDTYRHTHARTYTHLHTHPHARTRTHSRAVWVVARARRRLRRRGRRRWSVRGCCRRRRRRR